jgi:alpha-tubulin suppressor-like RCC1 family protein
VGGFTDWVQVCAGADVSLGLRNGTAWAWGYNNVGQLGDNTTTNRSSPVSVLGGINNWFQVSTANRTFCNAGCTHTLGVTFG